MRYRRAARADDCSEDWPLGGDGRMDGVVFPWVVTRTECEARTLLDGSS